MEETRSPQGAEEEICVERWLAVMLLAIVPMCIALVVGKEFVLHLATISGILFAAGIAMFVAHERRRQR